MAALKGHMIALKGHMATLDGHMTTLNDQRVALKGHLTMVIQLKVSHDKSKMVSSQKINCREEANSIKWVLEYFCKVMTEFLQTPP